MREDVIDVRSEVELEVALNEADQLVNKKYLENIETFDVKEIDNSLKSSNVNSMVRLNKICKIIYDANENVQDKLLSVYNAVSTNGGSIVNVIIGNEDNVDFYVGTKSSEISKTASCQAVLKGTFEGNFQGSVLELQRKSDLDKIIGRVFQLESGERNRAISVVNGIPGIRNNNVDDQSEFVQGMEKIIDSMRGQKFALVTIADSVSRSDIWNIKSSYEDLYSRLSPFVTTNLTFSESESDSIAESLSNSFTSTFGKSLSNTLTNSTSTSESDSKTTSNSSNFNASVIVLGKGKSKSDSVGKTTTSTNQKGESNSSSTNESTSQGKSESNTTTLTNTSGRTLQLTMENKKIKNLLDSIDKQVERIDSSLDHGLWNVSSYCIADDSHTSKLLANAVSAVSKGETLTTENFSICTWENNISRKRVTEYLEKFSHPVLEMQTGSQTLEVNPSTLINSRELVIGAGLPLKSVNGVPVSKMVAFSRNVIDEVFDESEKSVTLGNMYHMGKEENTKVCLNLETLSSHTLITGSTGSGKSNTVYNMISELESQDINFLVIEPAKGEYKHYFGNKNNVNVYGTNDKYTELLKINPFEFPSSVDVLEHVDRLIEIFNVCWPMYAAMPAILKEAILKSYRVCGWDLNTSKNRYGNNVFPTFKDLLIELEEVIDKSAYSQEIKSNYIGSLVTRVKSLTNGLNGKIFSDNSVSNQEVFDQNAIIDLSRVGSLETKSLIMGIMIMKLNEYRMDQAENMMNQKLKHVTVLEEAHNILRNSSGTSNSEGGNLSEKSVEMISNSIAEMRTYGEGFIIVDQSPNAIDISAIRNTNTKIVMRLPEESDRQQVGKSAALTDKQLPELAKLKRGVAVVYQNNWLDPVLCKIKKSDIIESLYEMKPRESNVNFDEIAEETLKFLMKTRVNEEIDYNIDVIENNYKKLNISTTSKLMIKNALECEKISMDDEKNENENFENLSRTVVDILGVSDYLNNYTKFSNNYEILQLKLNEDVERIVKNESNELKLALSQCLLRQLVRKDNNQVELYSNWRKFVVNERL